MLQASLRKTILGAAVIAAAAIGFGGSAQAKTVPIKWDPIYGGSFPDLGWSGVGSASFDPSCASLTGWVSNSNGCSVIPMSLTGLTLTFYNVANPNTILDTLALSSPTVYEMYFQSGTLRGVSAGFSAPVTSTLPIAKLDGITPVWWHMTFEKEASPTTPSVQLYWTKDSVDPICLFKTPQCEGGFSENRAILTVVPEPETYALMLAGLGVVGFMVRRRRQ